MKDMEKKNCFCDRIGAAALFGTAFVGAVHLAQYIALGHLLPFFTMLVVQTVLVLIAFLAWRGRLPFLLIGDLAAGIVLYANTNYAMLYPFNIAFLVQAILCGLGAIAGIVCAIREKKGPRAFPWRQAAALLVILAVFLITWKTGTDGAKAATGTARREIWAVPSQFDNASCSQPGTVEELFYETRAYATDGRTVQKSALVYLPYGYDETLPYNILYLMHGTGDDQYYWLQKHSYNKVLLDNMIASGNIEPLIVVTPTFYVEDDCADDLDQLTYSFRDELRNDLMPAVEGKYSTWAETADDTGFAASRDHRAFAGLSRGAVTTYHSVFCGSLDYFSWFGAFSGSRTDAQYFQEHLQSEAFRDLPIHYLYVASGNFDFALVGQLQEYEDLLEVESRLTYGVNTLFDIFPMRYHSQGNWHLALYNFLQKVF